jgi:hypothetical protein
VSETHNPKLGGIRRGFGGSLKVVGSNPTPGTFGTLIIQSEGKSRGLLPSFLSSTSYYDFLASLMITLFVIAIIVVFVYEYEALRRSKT